MLIFSPKSVSKELLAALPERSREMIATRFGLAGNEEKRTLEAIGQKYGITRERVRQIENHGLASLRASEVYAKHAEAIRNLEEALRSLGGVLPEDIILTELPKGKAEQNALLFLLTVGHPFNYQKEDTNFIRRWHVDQQLAGQVHNALASLSDTLETDQLIAEEEFVDRFAEFLKKEGVRRQPPEVLVRWLTLAKRIGRNPLGEWGRADSPHVRVKSMRDYAYLTLKRNGSPMHFTEVAKAINELFGRRAHPATCHNELIKDERFVLVGRGLYALEEWGYSPGVVREVIRDILKKEGPLTRDEIIDRVKRERYVKDATIIVNLQDNTFTRQSDGRYSVA